MLALHHVMTAPIVLAQGSPADIERVCGEEPGPICTLVLERTGNELLATLTGVVAPKLAQLVLIVVLAVVASRIAKRLIKRFVRSLSEQGISKLGALRRRAPLGDTGPADLTRAAMRAETVGGVLRSLAVFAIWTLAVFMLLGTIGINLGPLIAGAGIAGVALGFGAQALVRDFLSGIFMLMEDQYGIGDIVDTGMDGPNGYVAGIIEGITLRTTRLRDVYGTVWYVPNGQIVRVGNLSQQWARTILDVGVAYNTNIPFASGVIKRVADDLWQDPEWSPLVLEEPEVWGVENFGPNEIVIRLVLKTVPGQQFGVNRELRARIKAAFDAEGIEIPFPQRTVWMHQADDGSAAAAMETTRPQRNASETTG